MNNNCLLAGYLCAGQRAAAIMSLIQSARFNWHDLYAYLRDVMARLGKGETQPVTKLGDCKGNTRIAALVACLQPDRRVGVELTGTR